MPLRADVSSLGTGAMLRVKIRIANNNPNNTVMKAYTWFDGALTAGIQTSELHGERIVILGQKQLKIRTVLPFNPRRPPLLDGKKIVRASVSRAEWNSACTEYQSSGWQLETPAPRDGALLRLDLRWEYQSGSSAEIRTVEGCPVTIAAVSGHVKLADSAGFWPDMLISMGNRDRIRILQSSPRFSRAYEIECIGSELLQHKAELCPA